MKKKLKLKLLFTTEALFERFYAQKSLQSVMKLVLISVKNINFHKKVQNSKKNVLILGKRFINLHLNKRIYCSSR